MWVVFLISGLFLLTLLAGYAIFSWLISAYGLWTYVLAGLGVIVLCALGVLWMWFEIQVDAKADRELDKKRDGHIHK